jgi:alpha/beta superfamily hydrolase
MFMVLMIPSVAGDLEAHLRKPEGELRGAAVLCHPHPVYGGTMDNRVVYRAAKSTAKAAQERAPASMIRGLGKKRTLRP